VCQLTEVFNNVLVSITHAHRREVSGFTLGRGGIEDVSWLGSSSCTGSWLGSSTCTGSWLGSESRGERGGTQHTRGWSEGLVGTGVGGCDGKSEDGGSELHFASG
jgi:hypothetical protein